MYLQLWQIQTNFSALVTQNTTLVLFSAVLFLAASNFTKIDGSVTSQSALEYDNKYIS